MTLARAIADYRTAIIREIDRRLEQTVNRKCYGFVALEEFKLWLLTQADKEKEEIQ